MPEPRRSTSAEEAMMDANLPSPGGIMRNVADWLDAVETLDYETLASGPLGEALSRSEIESLVGQQHLVDELVEALRASASVSDDESERPTVAEIAVSRRCIGPFPCGRGAGANGRDLPCDCEAMATGSYRFFTAAFYRLEAATEAQIGVELQVGALLGIDEDGTVTNSDGTPIFRLVFAAPERQERPRA